MNITLAILAILPCLAAVIGLAGATLADRHASIPHPHARADRSAPPLTVVEGGAAPEPPLRATTQTARPSLVANG